MELPEWALWLIFAIGIAYWAFGYADQCDSCKKKHAMKRTGREEKKGFFENDLYEKKCKYCGHREWKEKSSD